MPFSYMYDVYTKEKKGLNFFDTNCWIGEESSPCFKRFKRLNELEEEMDKFNIKESLVSHIFSWRCGPKEGNDVLAQQLHSHQRFWGSYVLVPPDTGEFGNIERYIDQLVRKNRARVFRIFPLDHHFSVQGWSMGKVFSIMQDRRLPLVISLGQLTWAFNQVWWDTLYYLSTSYPHLPIIVDGHSTQELTQSRFILPILKSCFNLYLDIHNLIQYRIIEEIVKQVGAEKLLFSSGIPFSNPGASVMRVLMAEIQKEEKAKIAEGNIRKILSEVKVE